MVSEKTKIILYLAISAILYVIASINSLTVYGLLLAFVPLILILKESLLKKSSFWIWPISIFATLILGYLVQQLIILQPIDKEILIYAIGLAMSTSLYWFINKQLNSNLGLLIVIILWLAYDYLILSLAPDLSRFFIFNSIELSVNTSWTTSTGFMGITLWGLISNFLLANILFDPKSGLYIKMRWLSLLYVLIFITLPIWILEFWLPTSTGTTYQTMVDYYSGLPIENTKYALRGEWIGRTCSWIAVLIVVYSLVKRRVTK